MRGLAVISGNRLVDYHIQLRKEAWTPRKRELIRASLQPWIEGYSIESVALSIPNEKQTSKQTKDLLECLKRHFTEKKIHFSTYYPKTIFRLYKEAKTKKEIMRNLALQYPDLLYHYGKEMRNKNKYYIKLFEAVAVATIHSQGLKGRRLLETGH